MSAPNQRIVLITGANQGLGFEVVKKLAAEKENYLIILCSRDLKRGQDAVANVTALAKGSRVEALQLDVTSDESIAEAKKAVEERYGRVDVLFNNAGISHGTGSEREAMLQGMSRSSSNCVLAGVLTDVVYEVNVVGVVLVTKAFLPLLMKSDIKRLVIMSSDVGSIAWAIDPTYKYHWYQDTAYKPSKAAVNMVGAVMSVLHGKNGLRVNIVNPALRATAFNNYHDKGEPAEGGALEACRVITLGNEGEVLTYTEDHNQPIPW